MKNPHVIQLEQQDNFSQQGGGIDLQVILSLLKDYWYYFLVAIIIALFCARFYINHTMPVYRTSVTLLVNESEDRQLVDNSELLQGLGLPVGMRNLENQILILKSRSLTESTLKELPFDIEYYFKTIKNRLPVYPETPIMIMSDTQIPLPKNTEFSITFLDSMFIIASEVDNFKFVKTASFGQTIKTQDGSFLIECLDKGWLSINKDKKLFLTIHSRNRLVDSFSKRLNVEKVSREGSVLKISIQGTNRRRDVDFLNKHISGFQAISLTRKNTEAERRIEFIDDQLVGISDSLQITESRLQQFRSSNRVMDLSAQGQAIIGQVTLLENERARLDLEANYYDYLADYLNKEVSGEMPIVPITMGISDPGLTRLVDELTNLQGQLSATGAGDMNPLQRNLAQRVRTAKDALRETLNGLRRANGLARTENQQQINKANAQASALPVTERQLLGIERKFKLNDELYTYLLETRAEQQMQKASNRADSEVIDPADERFSALVSPIPAKIYSLGLAAANVMACIFIYLKFLFNKTLKEENIRKMTDIPVVGNIPHNSEKTNTVVIDFPNSAISEAYRLLRSRMQFFTKETLAPVILITSSIPGEGKTYTSINLASAYSLLGKKTVLVGFDLRKPGIFKDFNLKNERGVSTYLIGKDNFQDIIQNTPYENLSVILAGPIPPNPSELTALGKTDELIKLLKVTYDYIIIDTSPIGIVSETIHLASLSDTCLIVAKPGKTLRNMFEITLNVINTSEIRGACLVINDIKSDSKHYGYGEKYGYTGDKKHPKRHFFYRKSARMNT